MGDTKTTIEISGDTIEPVETATAPEETSGDNSEIKVTVHSSAPYQPTQHPKFIDGFMRRPKPAATAQRPAKPASAKTAPQTASKQVERKVHPVVHHKPASSKTLMRTAVKKPLPKIVPSAIATVAEQPVQPVVNAIQSLTSKQPLRGLSVSKSALISRFGSEPAPSHSKRTADIPVTPHPAHAAPRSAPAITAPKKEAVDKVSHLFENALEQAASHHNPPLEQPKTRHRIAKKLGTTGRVISIGATTLSVLLLAGFIAYQNVPNFAMRIAQTKAGFNASLPGYSPSGFSLKGPIQYSPGQVTISFKSNTDDRSFQVTQKPSDWNSQTLLDQFVAANRTAYQTYQDKGKTIYVYGGSNATWVDGGVWYQIESQAAALSSDQLLKIANSL